MLDERRLASSLVQGAKAYIDKTLEGVLSRLSALEKRQPERGEKGEPGKPGERGPAGADGKDGVGIADALLDRDGALVVTLSNGQSKNLGVVIGKDGCDGIDGVDGKDGRDGKDGEQGPEGPRGEPGPAGEDGKDGAPGPAGEPGERGERGPDGPAGRDGKDADIELVKSIVSDVVSSLLPELVSKAVDALPKPKDGADGKDGAPGERGATGPAGADGVGLAGGFVNRDGNLVITTTDGRTLDLGAVVGKDGEPGKDGANGIDGQPGRDGADGFGFDDLTAEYDGERTISLKFVKGDRVKSFSFDMPIVLDRGVYREGGQYKAGDAVTWAGSVWIAQTDTDKKPDSGADWRLSVKRGRDGRSAQVERGPATNVPVSS